MTPDGSLGTYAFYRHAIAYRLCRTRGIQPFCEDIGDGPGRSVHANIRRLGDFDPSATEVTEFDGRVL